MKRWWLAKILPIFIGLACLAAFKSLVPSIFAEEKPLSAEARVDPRIELFSTIFRLAGLDEYSQNCCPKYIDAVNAAFKSYRDHPAVAYARKLKETVGMGFNAPMDLAIQITDIDRMTLSSQTYPVPDRHDGRWNSRSVSEFLILAKDFVRETRFQAFFEKNRSLYAAAEKNLNDILKRYDAAGWLKNFFGQAAGIDFRILISMQNGGPAYAGTVFLPGGRREGYAIPSVWMTDAKGDPVFNSMNVSTIVHEFCHLFVNPLVLDHSRELEKAGKIILARVQDDMDREHYGRWSTMLYESIVRACQIRFQKTQIDPASFERDVAYETIAGFVWMRKLAGFIDEYESRRDQYAAFESFFPRIVGFFQKYTANIEAELEELRDGERAKWADLEEHTPKIVSLVPENGSKIVDPNLKEIRIEFDRPMGGGFAFLQYGSSDNYPDFGDAYGWDSSKTTFIIPVTLKPNHHYLYGLNAENQMGFADRQKNPLIPVIVKFKTRE